MWRQMIRRFRSAVERFYPSWIAMVLFLTLLCKPIAERLALAHSDRGWSDLPASMPLL